MAILDSKKFITAVVFMSFLALLIILPILVSFVKNAGFSGGPKKAAFLSEEKMLQTKGFDFNGEIIVNVEYGDSEKNDQLREENVFNYRFEGYTTAPKDYYVKISSLAGEQSKNKGKTEGLFDISYVSGKKYLRLLKEELIGDKSRNYGLASTGAWKEADPAYLMNDQKTDIYNISLVLNPADYLIGENNMDLTAMKMIGETADEYQYGRETESNESGIYAAGKVAAIAFPESSGKYYIKENVWVNKNDFLVDKKEVNIKAVAEKEGKELGVVNIGLTSVFSNYGGKKSGKQVLETEKIGKNNRLADSVNSSNLADMGRKRKIYFMVQGLYGYYGDNGGYPISAAPANADDENSPLAKLAPKYFIGDYLKDSGENRHFIYKSDGKNYELSAVLEDKKDKWCLEENGNCVYKVKNGTVVSIK